MLGVPALLVLLGIAHRTGGRARVKRVFRWVVVAAPLAAGYAGVGFLAYAVWCSAVRGVDPGIGDGFVVPLGRGFSLSAIDVPDDAAIYPRHEIDGVPLVPAITRIGQSGLYVYGFQGADTAFVLDTESGTVRRLPGQELPDALREVGVVRTAVEPVDEFYASRRWGWPDLLAAALLATPVLWFGGRSFRRAWSGADAQAA